MISRVIIGNYYIFVVLTWERFSCKVYDSAVMFSADCHWGKWEQIASVSVNHCDSLFAWGGYVLSKYVICPTIPVCYWMSFQRQKQHPLVCIWFKITKQTVRENSTRQEAVAFGQNQNIICDSAPCQGCVVWIVIAGNIVIGKGLRQSNQKHASWGASFWFSFRHKCYW